MVIDTYENNQDIQNYTIRTCAIFFNVPTTLYYTPKI